MKLKNLLLQIHLYVGLFCTPYLIIFGVSSLSFNHANMKEAFTPIDSTLLNYQFDKVNFSSPKKLDSALTDSLKLMGWFIPWESHVDSVGFHVNHRHLGRDYRFSGEWGKQPIKMVTNSTRKISMIKGLHGLGEKIPGAPWWINAWQYYQDLTVYALLFWVCSGLIMWWQSKTRNMTSTIFLFGSVGLSIGLMIYLWLVG